MKYGYCRISTKHQSLERQVRNILRAYPEISEKNLVQEVYTGTKSDRPRWQKLYRSLRAGDTVVFDSVSRMSRNAEEGWNTYKELYERGVELVFLKEPNIDTKVYKAARDQALPRTGTAVDAILQGIEIFLQSLAEDQVKLAFGQAEKEVLDDHQRTKEGIEVARGAGKQIGQAKGAKLVVKKAIAAKEVILKHNISFGGSLGDPDTIKLAGVSRNSFYKYKAELRQEMQKNQ